MLLLDDGHCFRDQAIAACATAGLTEASYRATSLQTLVQMAAHGKAVTLPSYQVRPGDAIALTERAQRQLRVSCNLHDA